MSLSSMKPYVFDLELSGKGLRINRFLNSLTQPAVRQLFSRDPEQAMQNASLSQEEKAMIENLDWRALMNYGASFFCLEKLGRMRGVSNPEMVAAFRGETLDEFLRTRRVPGAR
jgi:gallate dioxygenase